VGFWLPEFLRGDLRWERVPHGDLVAKGQYGIAIQRLRVFESRDRCWVFRGSCLNRVCVFLTSSPEDVTCVTSSPEDVTCASSPEDVTRFLNSPEGVLKADNNPEGVFPTSSPEGVTCVPGDPEGATRMSGPKGATRVSASIPVGVTV